MTTTIILVLCLILGIGGILLAFKRSGSYGGMFDFNWNPIIGGLLVVLALVLAVVRLLP